MLNQVILVGRLMEDPITVTFPEGNTKTVVTLEINRPHAQDLTAVDHVPVTLWNDVSKTTLEYCKAGSIIGVKASIKTDDDHIEIVGSKVTFINTKKQ